MSVAVAVVSSTIAFLGGGAFGALIRQPEINRLKSQVRVLQLEVESSNNLVKNATRNLELFELKYHINNNTDIIFDMNNEDYGEALYACGLYDYLSLKCKFLLEDKKLSEEEATFVDAFAIHLSEQPIDEVKEREINLYIKEYLEPKYKETIMKGIHPDYDKIIEKIEKNIVSKTDFNSTASELPLSELSCLTISEQQMRIMYSLEYCKIAYDRDHTKDEVDRTRKEQWLIKWSNSILKSINKGKTQNYFYNEDETFEALLNEYKASYSPNWYFIIMMETYLFSPYFLFDEANKKNNPWKGLKCTSDYTNEICSRQKVVDEEFFKNLKRTYNSSLSYLDERNVKAAMTIGTLFVTTIATMGLSYFFAPAIAIGLVGSGFSTLSGQALVNASLAYIGGGAIAAGGSGIAGGTALITGGGAILGAAGSGAASIGAVILSASPEITLRECAKLITCIDIIISKNSKSDTDAKNILSSVEKRCVSNKKDIELLEKQLETLEKKDKEKIKESKELVSRLRISQKYFERTRDKLQKMLSLDDSSDGNKDSKGKETRKSHFGKYFEKKVITTRPIDERNSPRVSLTIRANEYINGFKSTKDNEQDYQKLIDDLSKFISNNKSLSNDDIILELYGKLKSLEK